jgi:hypothetical protein
MLARSIERNAARYLGMLRDVGNTPHSLLASSTTSLAEEIAADFHSSRVNLIVKSCKRCGRVSNCINPFTNGPYAAEPFLPWGYGTHVNPGGNVCKACVHAAEYGGFLMTYKSFEAVDQKAKHDQVLHEEFRAVTDRVIELYNRKLIFENQTSIGDIFEVLGQVMQHIMDAVGLWSAVRMHEQLDALTEVVSSALARTSA